MSRTSFLYSLFSFIFFFNDTATTEIYTLSLHDALPISADITVLSREPVITAMVKTMPSTAERSEEHTSELQSQSNLVCRLLLEKKNKHKTLSLSTYVHYLKHQNTVPHQPIFSR